MRCIDDSRSRRTRGAHVAYLRYQTHRARDCAEDSAFEAFHFMHDGKRIRISVVCLCSSIHSAQSPSPLYSPVRSNPARL